MGKKGKKTLTGKPKKPTPKDIGKRLDALVKKLEEELKGADLFAPLPPTEDCAICLVPLSRVRPETVFKVCCGKDICKACHKENEASIKKQNEENADKNVAFTCPFCREPVPTDRFEYFRQLQARSLQNDRNALMLVGNCYLYGDDGAPKDNLQALDCFIRAVELGSAEACTCIKIIYDEGRGVPVDRRKATFFAKVGALRGEIVARHNIGYAEYYDLRNYEIAIRHWKIAAEAGSQISLNALKNIYSANGKRSGKKFITKEYLDFAYRACHEAQMEVKSEEREKYRCKTSTKFKC